MAEEQINNLVLCWAQAENKLKQQDPLKETRAEIKKIKSTLVQMMHQQQIQHLKTPHGWLELQENSKKSRLTMPMLKTMFCKFHQRNQSTNLSLEEVAQMFIDFVELCLSKTGERTITLHKSDTAPFSVYVNQVDHQQN